jgi:hypothetical protein
LRKRLLGLLLLRYVVVRLEEGKRLTVPVCLERPSTCNDEPFSITRGVAQLPLPSAGPQQLCILEPGTFASACWDDLDGETVQGVLYAS